MDRSELLAQLRGHGNHLNVTRSEHPGELAKGMGLLLLGLEQLLLDEEARGEGVRSVLPTRASALRPDLAPHSSQATAAPPKSSQPRHDRIQRQLYTDTSLNMPKTWDWPR